MPTRTLALPYQPQDWFSRLRTIKYQQLMPDPFDSATTPAKPTRTLALPCHSQDWFLRLKTSKYQQLMHDLFDFETWDFYRFFTNTPMETSDPASIREMSEAANNFGSPAE